MSETRPRRARLPWIVALVGIGASLGAWRFALVAEERAIGANFEAHAVERALHIQRRLIQDVSAVESVAAVFAGSSEVTREEFRTVTAHLLARHPSLRALSWDPLVQDAEREAYEAAERRAGFPGYRIIERSESGEMVPAARRAEYCVVRYVEPYAGNEAAVGFDVASEPRRRVAMERAAATGEPALTAGIVLLQEANEEQGFLVFWPHYRTSSSTNASDGRELEGYVVGVFQVRDVVQTATAQLDDEAMVVRVEDVTDPEFASILYRPSEPPEESKFEHFETFELGGRTWGLWFAPAPHVIAAHRTGFPTATLLVGFAITVLCVFYLRALLQRARRIEQLANERAAEIERRKRAEQERRLLDAKLQASQKLESLGVLAGGIAHDFNNLLTGILGNADLALTELSPVSPGREELEQIRSASLRAADLTREMLDYSGRGRFASEVVDLSRLVEEMVHLLESSISKKAQLQCDLAPDLPEFMGDPTQIRQVVMNLITNASDALGKDSGVISIRTGQEIHHGDPFGMYGIDEPLTGRCLVLEIADTGCGMDPTTRARIFDPFFTTKFKGRGLGLAAVLGIMRSHGGAIRVHTEPGRGTTFTVLLPCLDDDSKSEQEMQPAVAETRWSGSGMVLVVDDEEPIRRLAARVLKRLGFSVRTAADGVEGLRVFRKHADEIVAVLLDVTMPRMGGVETLQGIRAVRPDVKILFSSGYDREDSLDRLDGAPPDGFLQKPYTAGALADALRTLLGA